MARPWALGVTRAMELLWLLTAFLVPITFISPESMANGFEVPKVTLYRSLVGMICALWLIEGGLNRQRILDALPQLSMGRAKEWLLSQPTRIVLVAAWAMLAGHLVSTLLSSSIPISLWGREPAADGASFYNTFSHFMLFLVLSTHLRTPRQLWRLFSAVIASGLLVGLYAALQFYELDPFGIQLIGGGIVSSLGNPIFVGAFLLMVAPMTMALALRSPGSLTSPVWTVLGITGLTTLMLGMAYTQSRGPWVGLTAAIFVFLLLVLMAAGWRASLRTLLMTAAAIGFTAAIVTLFPSPSGRAPLSPRALSVGSAVVSALSSEFPNDGGEGPSGDGVENPSGIVAKLAGRSTPSAIPNTMETRLLLWKGSVKLALDRPWFQPEDRPLPLTTHLFGYGPEFFQYLFPLIHPQELSHLNIGFIYYGAREAHNNMLHRWVETGFFGLASYLLLLGAVAVMGIRLIRDDGTTLSQRLPTVAVLASVAGRSVEQLAGIPHLTDEALFWTLIGVLVAAPVLA